MSNMNIGMSTEITTLAESAENRGLLPRKQGTLNLETGYKLLNELGQLIISIVVKDQE